MDKYKQYLAVNVISEEKIVSYRQLSRALKVQVDTAKQMLYSFHKDQNAKRLGAVHATYTIIGKRPPIAGHTTTNRAANGDDEEMDIDGALLQSSAPEKPETNEADEEGSIPVTAVIMVQEEDLEAAKETFDVIDTIFVYSLEKRKHSNVEVLSTCNYELRANPTDEDPLESWKIYGGIRDPNCKKRKSNKPPPAATLAGSTTAKPTSAPAIKANQPTPAAAPAKAPTSKPTTTTTTSLPAAKQKFNPFAKFTKENAAASAKKAADKTVSAPAAAEDTTMSDAPLVASEPEDDDEDEDEDDDDFPVVTTKPSAARKDASERMRKLREDMARAEQEEAEAEAEAEAQAQKKAAAAASADEDEDMTDAPPPAVQEPAVGAEQNVQVQNGRRRGRRKVVKKRTVKDEEGYLVTREEQVWESFSEDEPEAKKVKVGAAAAAPVQKKMQPAAGKAGQGNITSFFKKK